MEKTLEIRGGVVLLDEVDLAWAQGFSWRVLKNRRDGRAYKLYAQNGEGRLMHRLLLAPERHELVDHEDGNGLNNQRANLRVSTRSQNAANRGPQQNNTSGFKGVYWNKRLGLWLAATKINQVMVNLGHYVTKEEAHAVVSAKRLELFGEFASD